MIKGGNVSLKIDKTVNRSMYNAGIIAQLKHQGSHAKQIDDYINLRSNLAIGDGQDLYI